MELVNGNHINGRDTVVGIGTCCVLNGPGIESRWGARFSAPVQAGLEAHTDPYAVVTGSFSRG